MNTLDQLRKYSIVVADTADFHAIELFKPIDATTNPSLILKQAQSSVTAGLIEQTQNKLGSGHFKSAADAALDLSIRFGVEIANRIEGYVSTEVDARLSFNTERSIEQAHTIIENYQKYGIGRGRILIKLASTWEGIQAARALESDGIGCNLTLLFCEAQAIAAANANATLISPFVGRIYDWFVARGDVPVSTDKDPGVLSVRNILKLYKSHAVATIVMGASFRTADQVLALAGCDRLTISPALLEELDSRNQTLTPVAIAGPTDRTIETLTRDEFLLALSADPMANEKLADGITRFIQDQHTLEALLRR
ncbi:MAG: transaldolase [Gammaproteobacteria bacterium]|nr:transaldolase [Gammaproteobacteria bacterium]